MSATRTPTSAVPGAGAGQDGQGRGSVRSGAHVFASAQGRAAVAPFGPGAQRSAMRAGRTLGSAALFEAQAGDNMFLAESGQPGTGISNRRERERVGGDCRHSVSEGSHVGEVWRPVPKNLLHICTMRITINDATSIIARIRLLCIRMLAMSSFRAVRKPEAPSRSAKKNEGSKI